MVAWLGRVMAEGCSYIASECGTNCGCLSLNRSKSLSDLSSMKDHLTHKNVLRANSGVEKRFEAKFDQASSSYTPKSGSGELNGNVEAPFLLERRSRLCPRVS